MMKKFFLLVVIFLFYGCEEDPVRSNSGPPLPIIAFKGPQTSSTHAEAQTVVGWVAEFNAFSTALNAFLNTEPSVSGNAYTWSVVQEGVSYTLTGTMRPDSGYNWKLVLNGRRNDGVTYTSWTAYEGTTDASRRNAAWYIYAEQTTTKISDFLWTISSNLSLTGTLNTYTDGTLSGSTVITDNANGTGQILMYELGILRYKAVWLSNGTGHYEHYNALGVKESEGDWS